MSEMVFVCSLLEPGGNTVPDNAQGGFSFTQLLTGDNPASGLRSPGGNVPIAETYRMASLGHAPWRRLVAPGGTIQGPNVVGMVSHFYSILPGDRLLPSKTSHPS